MARLKPKFNLKEPLDGIRFKQFIFDVVEKYQKNKYVKNQHMSLKDQMMKSFLAKISNNNIESEELPKVSEEEENIKHISEDFNRNSIEFA